MQHIIGHCLVHPQFWQPWSSHSDVALNPALQHHAPGDGPQQCADLASRSPNASPEPVYLPSNKLISSAREALARCPPEQVLQCLRPFADRLRMQGWTLLIADCGKSGEHHKALSVFRAVPRKNVWHHSALIAALGACCQCEQALQHLEQLKQLALQDSTLQPNHVTYSAAIAACARVQRLDRIMQLFTEMQERGLEPDSVTFYIMQSTAVRGGQWQLVEDMLQTMHSKGIPARPMVYAAYIRQLCRNLQWNHALGVFLIMQDLGVPATSSMIAELLRTFNLCGKHRMAALLLKEAEAAGLVSSGGMYDSTLRGLLQAGHADVAAELCKFMQQTGGWQPTSLLLDDLQNGSIAVDQAAAAVEAFILQDDGAHGHAAAAVTAADQAIEAQASNLGRSTSGGLLNQASPQGSVGELGEAVSECVEHCESACYTPAAEGSCASDTETEKYAASNESSSVAASVVSAPLAGGDSCYKSCSTSASTDSLCASTSSFSRQQEAATQGSNCSDTAVKSQPDSPDRASVNTAGQQQSQRHTSGRTSSRRGSRPSRAPDRFQHYSKGHAMHHGTYHTYQHDHHHHQQQQQHGQHHRVLPHAHQQQQQQYQQHRHHWSRDGQRRGYYGVTRGPCDTHEQPV